MWLHALSSPKSWHALSSPCRDMPCRANVEACRAHVVASIPCQAHALMSHCGQTTSHKSCQAPMGWFFKRWLGGNTRRVVFLPMACRAHVVACMPCQAHALMTHCGQTTYHKSCQAPMAWFFKRLLGGNTRRVVFLPMACRAHVVACMPCQAHAVACLCANF